MRQLFHRSSLRWLSLLFLAALLPGCASKKKYDPAKARLSKFVDVPVQKLYDRALAMMNKKHRIWPFKRALHRTSTPRDMFTEVTRRPDAGPLRELAEIRIADSYRIEGSDLSYAEAIARYKTFLQFHATHPEAEEVQWQLSQSFYNQRSKPGRDQNMGRNAEAELTVYTQKYPAGLHTEEAKLQIIRLRDSRARHEISVGDYYRDRKAAIAVETRYGTAVGIVPALAISPEMHLGAARVAVLRGDENLARERYFTALSRPLTPEGKVGDWAKKALKELGALHRQDLKNAKKQTRAAAKKEAPEDSSEPASLSSDTPASAAAVPAASLIIQGAANDGMADLTAAQVAEARGDLATAVQGYLALIAAPLSSDGAVRKSSVNAMSRLGGMKLEKRKPDLCWPNKVDCATEPLPDAGIKPQGVRGLPPIPPLVPSRERPPEGSFPGNGIPGSGAPGQPN